MGKYKETLDRIDELYREYLPECSPDTSKNKYYSQMLHGIDIPTAEDGDIFFRTYEIVYALTLHRILRDHPELEEDYEMFLADLSREHCKRFARSQLNKTSWEGCP